MQYMMYVSEAQHKAVILCIPHNFCFMSSPWAQTFNWHFSAIFCTYLPKFEENLKKNKKE